MDVESTTFDVAHNALLVNENGVGDGFAAKGLADTILSIHYGCEGGACFFRVA